MKWQKILLILKVGNWPNKFKFCSPLKRCKIFTKSKIYIYDLNRIYPLPPVRVSGIKSRYCWDSHLFLFQYYLKYQNIFKISKYIQDIKISPPLRCIDVKVLFGNCDEGWDCSTDITTDILTGGRTKVTITQVLLLAPPANNMQILTVNTDLTSHLGLIGEEKFW